MDITKALKLATTMLDEHNIKGWSIELRSFKSTGGMTYYSTKSIGLSRNLIPLWTEAEVKQIMLHEIAHVLAGHAAGHGPKWSRIARRIGYKGGRTHNLATVPPKWNVVCANHGVIGQRHNRSRKAGAYCCVYCGSVVTWELAEKTAGKTTSTTKSN